MTVPAGSDAGEMVSTGAITTVRVADCGGVAESVTVMVPVPVAVGVPLSTPVDGSNDKPAGRFAADRMYGPPPPVAVMVVGG